jgi:hypothetical protein
MTKEEAISVAQVFVTEHELPAGELIEARHMKAERFNKLYGHDRYRHDFWVVEFWKRLPLDVLAETPGNILVVVEEVSGRVYQDFPGSA